MIKLLMGCLLCFAAGAGQAAVTVRDDAGNPVTLQAPARRIVSMSPHITELLFAAGGGERIVGAMNFSDYPEAAKALPLIGDNSQIDIERVIALKPDLLVAWQSGNTARQLAQLARLGIPIFYSDPHQLDEVATSLLRLGRLMGTDQTAQAAASQYRARIAALAAHYSQRPKVRVFYQVWAQPLYTLNGGHIASDAIRLCGGENVFAGLAVLAPSVGIEAVLQANPEVLIGGEQHEPGDTGVAMWKPYQGLLAVQRGNVFTLDGVLLTRPGPRIADGAAALCEKLELARQRRR